MRNIKSFNINFEKTETLKKFECRKFDDLTLKIKVLDNNSIMIPSNQDIRFYLRKSDKTILYQEDGINVNSDTGIITINVHNQATTCEGMVVASLEFKDSLGKTSTSLFVFEVKESINIDGALESIDEIQGLDAIKEFVNEARPEIERLRNVINEVEDKANEIKEVLDGISINKDELVLENNKAIENINNLNVLLEDGNTLKNNLSNLIYDAVIKSRNLEELIERINVIKEELDELYNGANAIKNDLGLLVNSANESRVNLENAKNEVDNVVEDINNNIGLVNEAKKELNDLIDVVNGLNSNLDNKIDEANNKSNEINEIISDVNKLIVMVDNATNNLMVENLKAESNINELNPLNVEADENIEELKALIKEAREIAIPALKAYIAEFAPAEDLTEVNLKLEELYNGLNELDIRFNNYYTREEVDNKIDEKISLIEIPEVDLSGYYTKEEVYNKDEVDNKIDEKIGLIELPEIPDFSSITNELDDINKKLNDIVLSGEVGSEGPPSCYLNEPENPYGDNLYYHIRFLHPDTDCPRILYIKKGIAEHYPYMRVADTGRKSFYFSTSSYITGYEFNGTSWKSLSTTGLTQVVNVDDLLIYSCSVDIKHRNSVDIEDGTLYHPANELDFNVVTDYNKAIEKKYYRVNHSVIIDNSPEESFIGYIINDFVGGDVLQSLYNNDNELKYSRAKVNGIWSEWKRGGSVDLSAYYTREEVDEVVKNVSVDLSGYYTKKEVDKKVSSYKGEIGYSEYKVKPAGFDEAFERLLENPLELYPSMKGNVVGWIMGTISRQTGSNASGARVPGVILLTDYNNTYDTFKPVISNSATNDRAFDIVQFKTTSDANMTYSVRNAFAYPCIIDSATGEFISGYIPSSSYHYTITDYYYSTVDIYNADNTIAYNKCEGEVESKITDFDECVEAGDYKVNIKAGDVIQNTPFNISSENSIAVIPDFDDVFATPMNGIEARASERDIIGILKVSKARDVIYQELIEDNNNIFKRMFVRGLWTQWSKESYLDIEPVQYSEKNGEYITNSLIELYNNNIRFEYGEYEVDSAKNSIHVENPLKEYTDIVMLKAGGFRQVLGCMVFPHKLDFHYSIYCNINMVLVDPTNKPDCMRLYIGYFGNREEAFHPINGLKKIKYCVFGY